MRQQGRIVFIRDRFGFISRHNDTDLFFHFGSVIVGHPQVGRACSFDVGRNLKGFVALKIEIYDDPQQQGTSCWRHAYATNKRR